MSLTSVDAAFSSLSKFFSNGGGSSFFGLDNIRVDASCDLVSALRHMAPPATNVVQYKGGGRMLDLESAIRELISQLHLHFSTLRIERGKAADFTMAIGFFNSQRRESVERCKAFLESHRYSLLEIYSDFEDLIRKVLEMLRYRIEG